VIHVEVRQVRIPISELTLQADAEIVRLGHAPSTLMQYRWAWNLFEDFCSRRGILELTDDAVTAYLQDVETAHREGRIKDWKRKLLRKSVLVLSEVERTGTYQWKMSRNCHPNDVLNVVFRPVQEHFESWLTNQQLALTTRNLYATVSRRASASWQERGFTGIQHVTGGDMPAVLVFLSGTYQPGSMRTVISAVRVLCRFLEETGYCAGLSRAVPTWFSRRVRNIAVLSADQVDRLTNSPDQSTVIGRRDRAMLLLAARTGLRPVDVVGLRLRDIDWFQRRITVTQHKTGAVLTIPLLADVGEAIANYLLNDRPAGVNEEHVFLRTQAPFTALSATAKLHDVSARAFTRTETASQNGRGRGFRILRAYFATRMLESKTPLPVISGALGHRSMDSATHYLAADEQQMRQCCLDFVGIEPRTARP
jgi:integrase